MRGRQHATVKVDARAVLLRRSLFRHTGVGVYSALRLGQPEGHILQRPLWLLGRGGGLIAPSDTSLSLIAFRLHCRQHAGVQCRCRERDTRGRVQYRQRRHNSRDAMRCNMILDSRALTQGQIFFTRGNIPWSKGNPPEN